LIKTLASRRYSSQGKNYNKNRVLKQEASVNIAQIAGKLRGKIIDFSGKVSLGLPKMMGRFVDEIISGIAAKGSVRLSELPVF